LSFTKNDQNLSNPQNLKDSSKSKDCYSFAIEINKELKNKLVTQEVSLHFDVENDSNSRVCMRTLKIDNKH
jgi:hypothetical protein